MAFGNDLAGQDHRTVEKPSAIRRFAQVRGGASNDALGTGRLRAATGFLRRVATDQLFQNSIIGIVRLQAPHATHSLWSDSTDGETGDLCSESLRAFITGLGNQIADRCKGYAATHYLQQQSPWIDTVGDLRRLLTGSDRSGAALDQAGVLIGAE